MISLLDFFIFLYIYGLYIIPPGFIIGILYIIRYFAFPLLTRNPNELVLMIGPSRVKFYRVTQQMIPFFTLKKGAYWFGEGGEVTVRKSAVSKIKIYKHDPLGAIFKKKAMIEPIKEEKPDDSKPQYETLPYTRNRLHVYVTAINQEIDELERIDTKVSDVKTHYVPVKQIARHAVQLPPGMLAFHRNWVLTIDQSTGERYLEPTKLKQPLKVNFFVRLGIILLPAQKIAVQTTNPDARQQTVTVQMVEQEIGSIEKNSNYNATFTYENLKMQRLLHSGKWMRKLMGQIDIRPILIMMGAVGAIILMFYLYNPASFQAALPPAPAGCTNC